MVEQWTIKSRIEDRIPASPPLLFGTIAQLVSSNYPLSKRSMVRVHLVPFRKGK